MFELLYYLNPGIHTRCLSLGCLPSYILHPTSLSRLARPLNSRSTWHSSSRILPQCRRRHRELASWACRRLSRGTLSCTSCSADRCARRRRPPCRTSASSCIMGRVSEGGRAGGMGAKGGWSSSFGARRATAWLYRRPRRASQCTHSGVLVNRRVCACTGAALQQQTRARVRIRAERRAGSIAELYPPRGISGFLNDESRGALPYRICHTRSFASPVLQICGAFKACHIQLYI